MPIIFGLNNIWNLLEGSFYDSHPVNIYVERGMEREKENAISKCHTADMDFGGSFDKRHRLKTVVR